MASDREIEALRYWKMSSEVSLIRHSKSSDPTDDQQDEIEILVKYTTWPRLCTVGQSTLRMIHDAKAALSADEPIAELAR